MARPLKNYLPEDVAVSILSDEKRQAKVIRYFASGKYIGNYRFENLGKQNFVPVMAVDDIHRTLTDMLYLPYEQVEKAYGSSIAELNFYIPQDIPPLLLFFSEACGYVAYLYSQDSVVLLYNVEMDLARLMAVFFHSLGIDPFEFELEWVSYDYNDPWLEDHLGNRKIGLFRA